jgi:hypothetical protein
MSSKRAPRYLALQRVLPQGARPVLPHSVLGEEGRRAVHVLRLQPRRGGTPFGALRRLFVLARRQRGAQLGDCSVELIERAVGEHAADARVELGRDQSLRLGVRGGARACQRDH